MTRRTEDGKNSLKPSKRVFVYALIGLFAFFARYTVHFGHDCEVLSPWKSIQEEGMVAGKHDSAPVLAQSQCHHSSSSEKNDSTNHSHETCPICSAYDQLQSGATLTYDVNFQITTTVLQLTATEVTTAIPFQINTFNHSPRSPPV